MASQIFWVTKASWSADRFVRVEIDLDCDGQKSAMLNLCLESKLTDPENKKCEAEVLKQKLNEDTRTSTKSFAIFWYILIRGMYITWPKQFKSWKV